MDQGHMLEQCRQWSWVQVAITKVISDPMMPLSVYGWQGSGTLSPTLRKNFFPDGTTELLCIWQRAPWQPLDQFPHLFYSWQTGACLWNHRRKNVRVACLLPRFYYFIPKNSALFYDGCPGWLTEAPPACPFSGFAAATYQRQCWSWTYINSTKAEVTSDRSRLWQPS